MWRREIKIFFTLFIFYAFFNLNLSAKEPISKARLDQLSGSKTVNTDDKSKWDERYNQRVFVYGKLPSRFLSDNFHFLKAGGSVLDMGMGEGRNAVFLSQKGFKVTGIDISSVAVGKAKLLAKEYGTDFKAITGSLNKYPFQKESFDSIICFYYVDRSLLNKMKEWLRPDGVIIFEAYTEKQKNIFKEGEKESDTSFVKEQELLHLFGKEFKILKFEEPDSEKAFRSSIVVKKIN